MVKEEKHDKSKTPVDSVCSFRTDCCLPFFLLCFLLCFVSFIFFVILYAIHSYFNQFFFFGLLVRFFHLNLRLYVLVRLIYPAPFSLAFFCHHFPFPLHLSTLPYCGLSYSIQCENQSPISWYLLLLGKSRRCHVGMIPDCYIKLTALCHLPSPTAYSGGKRDRWKPSVFHAR